MGESLLCVEPIIHYLNPLSQLNIACCSKKLYQFVLSISTPPSYLRLNKETKKQLFNVYNKIKTQNPDQTLIDMLKCIELILSGMIRTEEIQTQNHAYHDPVINQTVSLIRQKREDKTRIKIEYCINHSIQENTSIDICCFRIFPSNDIIYQQRIRAYSTKNVRTKTFYDYYDRYSCCINSDPVYLLYSSDNVKIWSKFTIAYRNLTRILNMDWNEDDILKALNFIANLNTKQKNNYDVYTMDWEVAPLNFQIFPEKYWRRAHKFIISHLKKLVTEDYWPQVLQPLLCIVRYWINYFHYQSIQKTHTDINKSFLHSFIGSSVLIHMGSSSHVLKTQAFRPIYQKSPSIHLSFKYHTPSKKNFLHFLCMKDNIYDVQLLLTYPDNKKKEITIDKYMNMNKLEADLIRKQFQIDSQDDFQVFMDFIKTILIVLPIYDFNEDTFIKAPKNVF